MCAQAFGDGESARFENCQVAAVHKRCHIIDIVQNRDVFRASWRRRAFEAGGIFGVFARQKDKVHVFEAA